MVLTESQRRELYESVKRSSLGEAGADIVMNAIPTIDWTDLATHNDLALLRAELREEMAELRSEMAKLRSEMRFEMAELRSEMRFEMAELRSDFRIEMGALETRLQRSIVTWILAAQAVTLTTIGLLISVMMIVLA